MQAVQYADSRTGKTCHKGQAIKDARCTCVLTGRYVAPGYSIKFCAGTELGCNEYVVHFEA